MNKVIDVANVTKVRNEILTYIKNKPFRDMNFNAFNCNLLFLGIQHAGLISFIIEHHSDYVDPIEFRVPYNVLTGISYKLSRDYTTEVVIYSLYIFLAAGINITKAIEDMGWSIHKCNPNDLVDPYYKAAASISRKNIIRFLKTRNYKFEKE